MASTQKRTAYLLLSFLQSSLQDGSIRADDVEGIEVASQCISEAFGVDLESEADKRAYSIAPETLASVLEKHVQAAASAAPTSATPAPTPSGPASAADKALAEKAKSSGNQLMAGKDYAGAIAAYGQAIALDGGNKVYWSNRAAAHSQLQDHASAIADARQAIVIDPAFSKAYSRLGHALFSSGEYEEAVQAYEKGLELDPANATMKSSLVTAKARVQTASSRDADDDEEGSGSVARGAVPGAGFPGLPAGFPGMGGAGGMPDMASMMQNPAIMQMAQQLMQSGGLESLMQNPMLQQMMSGGGMPDMNALMSDPTVAAMAARMGAGMGGGAGARRPGAPEDEGNANMYS